MAGPQDIHGTAFFDHLLEVRPVDVLHDQEVKLVVLVDVVSADDVGMIQSSDSARLAVKAFQRGRVLRLGGRQDFDGNSPPHELVFTKVNTSHAAGAHAFQN